MQYNTIERAIQLLTLLLSLGVEVTLSTAVDEVEEGGTFDVCVSREAVPLQNNISITLLIPEEQESEEIDLSTSS